MATMDITHTPRVPSGDNWRVKNGNKLIKVINGNASKDARMLAIKIEYKREP